MEYGTWLISEPGCLGLSWEDSTGWRWDLLRFPHSPVWCLAGVTPGLGSAGALDREQPDVVSVWLTAFSQEVPWQPACQGDQTELQYLL